MLYDNVSCAGNMTFNLTTFFLLTLHLNVKRTWRKNLIWIATKKPNGVIFVFIINYKGRYLNKI